jgi:MFS transporter, DHA3 family, tetracycline resistance protein
METGIALTNIAGIEIAHRCINPTHQQAVAWGLCLIEGVTLLGMGLFALTGQFALALAALWLITTASGPRIPLTQTWINQQTSSRVRATVLSFDAQVSALAAMGGGLLIGAIATALTTRLALLLAGFLLLPALILYAYTICRKLPSISTTTEEAEDSTIVP